MITSALRPNDALHLARRLVVFLAAFFLASPCSYAEKQAEPIRVLIVTGLDIPVHDWRATTPAIKEELEKDSRMKVEVLDDPYRLDVVDLSRFNVLFLHFMNWELPDPNDAAKANLKNFVERGGGLFVLHFACGAFGNWPEYAAIAGRVWDRKNTHDPRGPFRVQISNRSHSAIAGLDSFDTDDELYTCLTGDKPVEELAHAKSVVTRQRHPMALTHHYGKGRVFQTPLGHDVRAIRMVGTAELIRRGTAWAAGRDAVPAAAVPETKPSQSSAVPGPVVSAADADKHFKLPPGFEIRLVAAEPDVINPMTLCLDEQGNIFVTEAHTYRWGAQGSPIQPPTNPIKWIKLGADGRAEKSTVAVQGFSNPVIGVHAHRGKLYATCLNELFVMDIGPGGQLSNRKLLVKDAAEPWNPFGMYRVQVGPDEKLWLAIADHPGGHPVELTGSDGRVIRLRGKTGGMVRCNLDGSGLEIIVQGFRAPYAFDFDPWGHLWHISNGEGSPNLLVHVIFGMDYGYHSRMASYAWMAGKEPLSPPVIEMPGGANTAALQYYSDLFPRDYHGNVLIPNWGSHGSNPPNREIYRFIRKDDLSAEGRDGSPSRPWGRSPRRGDPARAHVELAQVESFLTSSDPMFRPTQIILAPDGGLYLIDWHGRDDENDMTGRIFKISYTGADTQRAAKPPAAHEISRMKPDALVKLLGHANHTVRRLAQRALLDAGTRSQSPLEKTARKADAFTAAHALQTIALLPGEAAAKLLPAGLKHADPRVRALALRLLRQAAGQALGGDGICVITPGSSPPAPAFSASALAKLAAPFLNDPDGEVRLEAALSQDSAVKISGGLLSVLEVTADRRLRYQVGFELARRGTETALRQLHASPDAERRQVALIAMDNAQYEKTALAKTAEELSTQVPIELPEGDLARKLDWLAANRPAFLVEKTKELLADPALSEKDFKTGYDVLRRHGGVALASDKMARPFLNVLAKTSLPAQTSPERLVALDFVASMGAVKLPERFILDCLRDKDPRVPSEALQLVRASGADTAAFHPVVLALTRTNQPLDIRLEAIFTLGAMTNDLPPQQWLAWLNSEPREIAIAAARALRQKPRPQELTSALLKVGTARRAVQGDGRLGEATRPALAQDDAALVAELAVTLRVLGVPGAELARHSLHVDNPRPKAELGKAVLASLPSASATMGRLSFGSELAGCAKCHSVRKHEGRYGPPLIGIGSTAQADYLVESILEPSASIKTGYESESVETRDGESLSGLVEADETKLTVRVSPDRQVIIPLSQVQSRTVSKLSTMPEGLEAAFSDSELADLVAFLLSLKAPE